MPEPVRGADGGALAGAELDRTVAAIAQRVGAARFLVLPARVACPWCASVQWADPGDLNVRRPTPNAAPDTMLTVIDFSR